MFYADLHVHSKFSRATSRDCDLEHLAHSAARKGIAVVGTGDFTHPGWWEELSTKLVPAEAGLYRLRPDLEQKTLRGLPVAQPAPVRFLLQVEIATIYKKRGQTRKIHHLIYMPELDQARRFTDRLSRLGNVASDGRPILGLDSRNLLELVLEAGPGCFLVPAHVWTPWFSVFGAHSGFDLLEECYEDLSGEIFALETGLSSDPPMNWRWSALDRYALVSNSDAHSPAKLGRECCVFDSAQDYFSIRDALRTGQGYAGTVEFFPEEGKYHLDGHRQCGVSWEPTQTRQHGGRCPRCGRPVTLGVLHRVCALADRPHPPDPLPPKAAPFRSLIPLCEILGEILQVGPDSKTVQSRYEELLGRLGPELWILEHAPLEQIARHGSELLAEAIRRMRIGQVLREPGYDGQYGVIRLFTPEELQKELHGRKFFAFGAEDSDVPFALETASAASPQDLLAPSADASSLAQEVGGLLETVPPPVQEPPKSQQTKESAPPLSDDLFTAASLPTERQTETLGLLPGPEHPSFAATSERQTQKVGSSPGQRILASLDPEQQAAVQCVEGPMLIVAGPGTGKTRVLTHRIAYLTAEHGVAPESCLAITFSRRAAAEMRERLHALVPESADRIPVMTFHAFGWTLLREYAERMSASGRAEAAGDPAKAARDPAEEASDQTEEASGPAEQGPSGEKRPIVPPAGSASSRRGSRWARLNWTQLRLAAEPDRERLLCELLNLSPTQAHRILSQFSLHKRRPGAPLPEEPKLRQAFQAYQEEMDQRGWLDFDDLVLLPGEILKADASWRAECQARYRFVSVDEFQDIDEAQYTLLRVLAPPEGNLCAIGDPDQSIYGFRGADAGFFERFLADYPTARRFLLVHNYRSSRVIVEAAGQMIAPASLVPDRNLRAQTDGAPHVEIHACPTERAEAEFVVHRIEQLLGGPTFFSLDTRRSEGHGTAGLSFSDIAVLYRTEAQAAPLVEALRRSGMPFQVCSHRPLVEDPAVRKVLQILFGPSGQPMEPPSQAGPQRGQTRASPRKEASRKEDSPRTARNGSDSFSSRINFGTSEAAVEPLDRSTFSSSAKVSGPGPSDESLRERVRRVLETFGQQSAPDGQEEPWPELSPMVRAALERIADACADDPEDFLAEIAWTTVADLWDERAHRISLLTLHAAKGLEFPVVFIVGCEDGLIPLRFSEEADAAQEAEERRLLFVGMTRSRRHLILTYARRRHWRGKVRGREPSPFLEDVRRELLAFQEHRPRTRPRTIDSQRKLFE